MQEIRNKARLLRLGMLRIMDFAAEFSDETRGLGPYPCDGLDIFLALLSDPKIMNMSGSAELIIRFTLDIGRLSYTQKLRILNTVERNYSRYENIETCWAIGDFIARNYDADKSLDSLKNIAFQATNEGLEGVEVGLSIIARGADRERRAKIELIHNSIKVSRSG